MEVLYERIIAEIFCSYPVKSEICHDFQETASLGSENVVTLLYGRGFTFTMPHNTWYAKLVLGTICAPD